MRLHSEMPRTRAIGTRRHAENNQRPPVRRTYRKECASSLLLKEHHHPPVSIVKKQPIYPSTARHQYSSLLTYFTTVFGGKIIPRRLASVASFARNKIGRVLPGCPSTRIVLFLFGKGSPTTPQQYDHRILLSLHDLL